MLQEGRISFPLQGHMITRLCCLCTAVSPKSGTKKGPRGRCEGMKRNKMAMVSHTDMQMGIERLVRVNGEGC